MRYPQGIHATVTINGPNGPQPLELAVGPAESLGELSDVVDRFVEAFCLDLEAESFSVEALRMCLFDPEALVVSFEADDAGRPDPAHAMGRRFAFAFIAQHDEHWSPLDPFLFVRPCTRSQVGIWHGLMSIADGFRVRTFCLDERLSGMIEADGGMAE